MRIVLYAEGSADRGSAGLLRPSAPLRREAEGPAHLLVRRLLVEDHGREPRFEVPLKPRGREAKGSDFRSVPTLRKLLTWAKPTLMPDLAIVLVDADGDRQIGTTLRNATIGLDVRHVIGVAVQEFEAWLIADRKAVESVLDHAHSVDDPESLGHRQAKDKLGSWIGAKREGAASVESKQALRTRLAEKSDLAEVARRCSSFERFRSEVGEKVV